MLTASRVEVFGLDQERARGRMHMDQEGRAIRLQTGGCAGVAKNERIRMRRSYIHQPWRIKGYRSDVRILVDRRRRGHIRPVEDQLYRTLHHRSTEVFDGEAQLRIAFYGVRRIASSSRI